MTECQWFTCEECGEDCPDYNIDGEPDDGPLHFEKCSKWLEVWPWLAKEQQA